MNGKWSVKHRNETSFSGLINRIRISNTMEDHRIKTCPTITQDLIPFEIKLTFQKQNSSIFVPFVITES